MTANFHRQQIGFKVWKMKPTKAMPVAHAHTDIEIVFLLKGEITHLGSYGYETLKENQGYVFWAGFPHRKLDNSDDCEGIWITLPIAWLVNSSLSEAEKNLLFKGKYLYFKDNNIFKYQFTQWLDEYQKEDFQHNQIIYLEIEAFLKRLCMNKAKKSFKKVNHIQGKDKLIKAVQYISKHYLDDLSIDDISKVIKLHPKYFLQSFKKTYGTSVWDFLTQLRIAHAQHLLVMTSKNIAEIVYASGFKSTAPFYQAFRKFCNNVSPMAYRKNISKLD